MNRGGTLRTGQLHIRLLDPLDDVSFRRLSRLPLWGLKRRGGLLEFYLRPADLPRLRELRSHGRPRLRIIDREGPPFWWRRLRRRPALWMGGLAAVGLAYFLSSFIWFVGVVGADPARANLAAQLARAAGLRPGVSRSTLNRERVIGAVEHGVPQLSWVGLETQGTIAQLQLVERRLGRRGVAAEVYGPLVALRPAAVSRLTVFRGWPVVSTGEAVLPGEVLVEPPEPGVPVDAVVWGYVYLEASAPVLTTVQVPAPTGRRLVRQYLEVGSERIGLFWPGSAPGREWEHRQSRWRNPYLPVEVVTDEYRQFRLVKVRKGLAAAREAAESMARMEIRADLGSQGKILHWRADTEHRQGQEYLRLRVQAETQIAGRSSRGGRSGTGAREIRNQGGSSR